MNMSDLEHIKNLKAAYFRYLDGKDWTAFRSVFTDDFISDTRASGGKLIRGADSFIGFVQSTLRSNPTVHHGHMPEIEILSDDSAKGIWAMEDLVRLVPFVDMRGYGHYHEQYQKKNGCWKISYSKLTRIRLDVRILFLTFKLPQFLIKRMQANQEE